MIFAVATEVGCSFCIVRHARFNETGESPFMEVGSAAISLREGDSKTIHKSQALAFSQ
jgi:hypothetical protein